MKLPALTCSAFLVLGCVAADDANDGRGAGGKADDLTQDWVVADEPYSYVVGFVEQMGQFVAGQHRVMIPSEDGREPIDSANRPSRLHPDLRGAEMMKFDESIKEGEAEWDIFASNWWPQSKNGIAQRWNSDVDDFNDIEGDPDNLSPSEKYDLLFHPGDSRVVKEVKNWGYLDAKKPEDERGDPLVHPEVKVAGPATAWELEHHGAYQRVFPDSWWGHCNGWASYVTAEPLGAPKHDVRVKNVDGVPVACADSEEGCILFRMADIEALMSELYFNDSATFTGRRCNTDPDKIERDEFGRPKESACRDINAGTMHVALTRLLATGARPLGGTSSAEPVRLPFIIDHNWDWQVWNFPIKKFEVNDVKRISEAEAMAAVCGPEANNELDCENYKFNENATQFAIVKATYYLVSDGVSGTQLLSQAADRNIPLHDVELNYVLELDNFDEILGGEWIKEPSTTWGKDSKELHPDFLWMAIEPRGHGEDGDDLGGTSDNPFISYSAVQTLLKLSIAEEGSGGEPVTANICAGQCGGESSGDSSCYCDALCVQYKDCCQDDDGGEGSDSAYVCSVCSDKVDTCQ